jgi:hypothetical protein
MTAQVSSNRRVRSDSELSGWAVVARTRTSVACERVSRRAQRGRLERAGPGDVAINAITYGIDKC